MCRVIIIQQSYKEVEFEFESVMKAAIFVDEASKRCTVDTKFSIKLDVEVEKEEEQECEE